MDLSSARTGCYVLYLLINWTPEDLISWILQFPMLVNKFVDSQNKQDFILSHRTVVGRWRWEDGQGNSEQSDMMSLVDRKGWPRYKIDSLIINKTNIHMRYLSSDVTVPGNINSIHSCIVRSSIDNTKFSEDQSRKNCSKTRQTDRLNKTESGRNFNFHLASIRQRVRANNSSIISLNR